MQSPPTLLEWLLATFSQRNKIIVVTEPVDHTQTTY